MVVVVKGEKEERHESYRGHLEDYKLPRVYKMILNTYNSAPQRVLYSKSAYTVCSEAK